MERRNAGVIRVRERERGWRGMGSHTRGRGCKRAEECWRGRGEGSKVGTGVG